MITGITLKNFKSFQEATLPLKGLTVLIGANASGKSNAIEALRLLSWLAHGQKLSVIQYTGQHERVIRGRLEEIPYCGGKSFDLGCDTDRDNWNHLMMTISCRDDGAHIIAESITSKHTELPLYNLVSPSSGNGSDAGVTYNNFSRGRNKPQPTIACTDQMALFTQLTSPAAFDNKHSQSQKDIPEITKQLEKWLSAMLFLDTAPERIREAKYSFYEQGLRNDGANLSGVIYKLWGPDDNAGTEPYHTQREELLKFIRSLPEQDISGLGFLKEPPPRNGVMLRLDETFGGQKRSYDTSLLSDGTLRVLAIAAAMISAEEGSLVVIEELDNGVHPSRASHLMENIRSVAERRNLRVLITTHNPALLDALPDSAIPDVVLCYRDPKDGSSKLVRLEDIPDYPELIAQGTLGDLVTTGVIERFVKQPHNDKERKRKALAWLDRVRKGDEQ